MATYRDDRDALRDKADRLEAELDAARDELGRKDAALASQRAELERLRDLAGDRGARPRQNVAALVGVAASLAVLGGAVSFALLH